MLSQIPSWMRLPFYEKLTLLVLLGVVFCVLAGFSFWIDNDKIHLLIKNCGLGALWTIVAITSYSYGRIAFNRVNGLSDVGGQESGCNLSRIRLAHLVLWILCSAIVISAFPKGNRILMDEIVVLSTSKAIHEEREPVTPTMLEDIFGVMKLSAAYIDKRPYLYAACVALFHDFLGYAPANAFYVNMLFGAMTLALVWLLGKKLGGHASYGAIAMLGLASIPLFAQNVTGGGIDIVNILCILLLVLGCFEYLQCPSRLTSSAMIGASLVLAYARYESIVYASLPLVCTAIVYVRRGNFFWDMRIPIMAAAAVPLLGINYLTFSNPAFWFQFSDKGVTEGFSFSYFSNNISHALYFFLNLEHLLYNSPLIFILGFTSFLLLCVSMASKRKFSELSNIDICFWMLCCVSVINFVLLMCYSWGELDQPVGSRLSLPLYLFFILAIVKAARVVPNRPACCTALGLVFAIAIYWSLFPLAAKNYGLKLYASALELQLFDEFIERQPDKRFAVVNSISNFWLTRDIYSVAPGALATNPEFLPKMVGGAEFRRIYVIQAYQKDAKTNQFVLKKSDAFACNLPMDFISEDMVGGDRKVRIMEIRRSAITINAGTK